MVSLWSWLRRAIPISYIKNKKLQIKGVKVEVYY